MTGPSTTVAGSVLIGREHELDTITAALSAEVPVTVSICGVSGSGKTALAQAAAARLVEQSGWELAWVDLELVVPGERIAAAMDRTLGVEALDREVLELAFQFRRVIVVLDGADQATDEVAEVVDALGKSPNIRVVVTSSRPVGGPNATVVSLAGLELPPEGSEMAGELAASPAVQLFVHIACSVDPRFEPDNHTLAEVARICRALSGLPLGIVLAAARVGMPANSSARLSRHIQEDPTFGLMLTVEGPADVEGRRRRDTVHEALAWSYSLLDPADQRIFRRVSVFHSPFALEAAQRVCDVSKYRLLNQLEHLVDLRLLEPGQEDSSEITFQLTPLLRAFASEALEESGEGGVVAASHAAWFAKLAEEASHRYDDACDAVALDRLGRVEADLYQALSFLTNAGDVVAALRLAADIGPLAAARGTGPDHVGRLAGLFDACGPTIDGALHTDALLWLAELGAATMAGPDTIELTRRRWREGMALALEQGDPLRVLRGLSVGLMMLPLTGDFGAAASAVREGRALATEIGHVRWLGRFTVWDGMVHHQMRDYEGAAKCAEEALQIALRASDSRTLVLVGLLVFSMPPQHAPRLPLLPSHEELAAIAAELQDRESQLWLLIQMAGRANRLGDYDTAADLLGRCLELVAASRSWHHLGIWLLIAAVTTAGRGDDRLAARTHGALMPIMSTLLGAMSPRDAASYETAIASLKARLGDQIFDEEVRTGSLNSMPEAVSAALPLLRTKTRHHRPPHNKPLALPGSELTRRELDVLALLAEGLTNKEIAKKLGVAQKTVMHHSMAIYQKLGVRGRAEAAAVAVRHGLVSN